MTHRKVVSDALEELTHGLTPYVEGELQRVYDARWPSATQNSFRRLRTSPFDTTFRWDAHSLLTVMWDQWNAVFRDKLGFLDRSLVSELREYRNRWAHQMAFCFDDAYRIVDNVDRLLRAIGRESTQVHDMKRELMHVEFTRQVTNAQERTSRVRKTWMNIGLWATSALGLASVVMAGLPSPTDWIISAGIGIAFVLVVQAETRVRPRLVGPHECQWCLKIVYTEECPYCQPEILVERYGLQHTGPQSSAAASAARDAAEAEVCEQELVSV